MKAITTGGGKLSRHEEQVLEGLEKELKAVERAREALGDAAPQFRRGGLPRDGNNEQGVLGKRRRDFKHDGDSSSDSDVPEDVRSIPMPRDTPPPIPKEVLDKWWAKRRAKRAANANDMPLGRDRGIGGEGREESHPSHPTPAAVAEAKTVYEAKPIVRDLRKEAVAFVPTVVRTKLDKGQGKGGLIEPEEADKLEQEGYLKTVAAPATGAQSAIIKDETVPAPRHVTMEEVEDGED